MTIYEQMKEALELCVQDMCRYCRAEARMCNLPQCLDGCETLKKAKAVLAAPPRNCDRYPNLHDAWLAWQADCAENMADQKKFHVWLYSMAEGGAK